MKLLAFDGVEREAWGCLSIPYLFEVDTDEKMELAIQCIYAFIKQRCWDERVKIASEFCDSVNDKEKEVSKILHKYPKKERKNLDQNLRWEIRKAVDELRELENRRCRENYILYTHKELKKNGINFNTVREVLEHCGYSMAIEETVDVNTFNFNEIPEYY